jgi:hypothetical protein
LLRISQESLRERVQDAVKVDALQAAQVDHVVAAREEGRGHDARQPAQREDPKILPLAMLALRALFQRVQLLCGDDAEVGGTVGVGRRLARGFRRRIVLVVAAKAAPEKRHGLRRG